MSTVERELVDELSRLRKGWALLSIPLLDRVGPRLRALCEIHTDDSDRVVRHKLTTEFVALAADFPADLRLSVHVGLALEARAQLRFLTDRIAWLAGQLHCEPRTARRRVEHGFVLLAQAAAGRTRRVDDDPERGWHVGGVTALLRLDTPTPELYDERMIVAERDGLSRIAVRFSLPRHAGDDSARHDLIAEVLFGAVIEQAQRLSEAHYRFLLNLPRPLARGETHRYQMLYRVPVGQPVSPHYVFQPLVACESFGLRVRFDPGRLPWAVWLLDGVPPRLVDSDEPGAGPLLEPDGAGEVPLSFGDLRQGLAYGIGWAFEPRPT